MNKGIKIIIGSSYGDEGKGRMTSYFADEDSLVVRFNGGSQAGHTVCLGEKRHIFHHFGSGTLKGAQTYLAQHFVLNPITFKKEWEELAKNNIVPTVFAHSRCAITNPFDILINQISETYLGDKRYGSCGLGIWETIERQYTPYATNLIGCVSTDMTAVQDLLKLYREKVFVRRLVTEYAVPAEFIYSNYGFAFKDELIYNYIDCLQFMLDRIIMVGVVNEYTFLKKYDNIIFEGAQGLCLDKKNAALDNVTASSTGCGFPFNKIVKYNLDAERPVELVYATRWYNTRHGNGTFNSTNKENISHLIKDTTNVPNEWQGTMRFGYLSVYTLYDRILSDSNNVRKLAPDYKISLCVGCLDQAEDNILKYHNVSGYKEGSIDDFMDDMISSRRNIFHKVYGGFGETEFDVRELYKYVEG